MRVRAAVLCAILLAPGLARADGEKSSGAAAGLAIGGTIAAVAITATGSELDNKFLIATGLGVMLVGPAAGHIYVGDTDHALLTAAMRLGGGAAFVYGLMQLPPVACEDFCEDDERNETEAGLIMLGGAVAFLGATGWDLIDAPLAARRHNLRLAPTVLPATDGRAPGLTLAGTF